jgi:hypothetical protein
MGNKRKVGVVIEDEGTGSVLRGFGLRPTYRPAACHPASASPAGILEMTFTTNPIQSMIPFLPEHPNMHTRPSDRLCRLPCFRVRGPETTAYGGAYRSGFNGGGTFARSRSVGSFGCCSGQSLLSPGCLVWWEALLPGAKARSMRGNHRVRFPEGHRHLEANRFVGLLAAGTRLYSPGKLARIINFAVWTRKVPIRLCALCGASTTLKGQ